MRRLQVDETLANKVKFLVQFYFMNEIRITRDASSTKLFKQRTGFFMRYVLLAFFYKGALLIGAIHARAKAPRMNL